MDAAPEMTIPPSQAENPHLGVGRGTGFTFRQIRRALGEFNARRKPPVRRRRPVARMGQPLWGEL